LLADLCDLFGLVDQFLGVDLDSSDRRDGAEGQFARGLGVGELRVGLDDEPQAVETVLFRPREQVAGVPGRNPVKR
jgi:hypothetical protein